MQAIIQKYINQPISIAPLVTFRILFGLTMCFGAIRFWTNDWVSKLYLEPKLFFKFYGFEWVQHPGIFGLQLLFGIVIISSLGIAVGLLYRLSAVLFFLSFSYIELLDATNYLNHYYLACLLGLLLIFLPANADFSLDNYFKIRSKKSAVPAWCINIIIFQLTLVYTFAGLAKLSPDWMLNAMPLSIWLPEHQDLPIVGSLFKYKWAAYLFSWTGAFYDLTIAFFLMWKKTRWFAYGAVLGFHILTGILFNIGLFPLIMITSTLIFFSGDFHQNLLGKLSWQSNQSIVTFESSWMKLGKPILIGYIALQLVLPMRHWLYDGNLLWTEEGYRFSWRVMLVEKIGLCTFFIQDSASNKKQEIVNGGFLTQFQEKQMSIQPDFILQFAQYLKKEYEQKHGFVDPIITVDSHVALNGRASQRFIDPEVNLANIEDGLHPKKWVMPFKE